MLKMKRKMKIVLQDKPKFYLDKCVSCPYGSSQITNLAYVNFHSCYEYYNCSKGKMFNFREEKCFSCGDNEAILTHEYIKFPKGSYIDRFGNCECENGE